MRAPKTLKPAGDKKLPRFKSRDEEALFWDTHSPLDFPEFKEVKVEIARPLGHVLAVRLDARTIDQLGDIGRSKGLGASTLARMWLLERLQAEGEARVNRQPKTARKPNASSEKP